MRLPNDILATEQLLRACIEDGQMGPGADWYPSRPDPAVPMPGFFTDGALLHRVRCAWLVFTGRADAIRWLR